MDFQLHREIGISESCIVQGQLFFKLIIICIVKAIVFPVVMYRCENWTIKKAECQGIDAFINSSVMLEKTLESLLESKEIKPVNPKGNQP